MSRARKPEYVPDDPLLMAAEAAGERGQAISTFWRDVRAGQPGEGHPDWAAAAGAGAGMSGALDRPIAVTFLDGYAATRKAEQLHTPRALAERIASTTAAAKEQLPWLKRKRPPRGTLPA